MEVHIKKHQLSLEKKKIFEKKQNFPFQWLKLIKSNTDYLYIFIWNGVQITTCNYDLQKKTEISQFFYLLITAIIY